MVETIKVVVSVEVSVSEDTEMLVGGRAGSRVRVVDVVDDCVVSSEVMRVEVVSSTEEGAREVEGGAVDALACNWVKLEDVTASIAPTVVSLVRSWPVSIPGVVMVLQADRIGDPDICSVSSQNPVHMKMIWGLYLTPLARSPNNPQQLRVEPLPGG